MRQLLTVVLYVYGTKYFYLIIYSILGAKMYQLEGQTCGISCVHNILNILEN